MHLMEYFIMSIKALLADWIPNTGSDFSTQSRGYKNNLPTERLSLCVVGDSDSVSGYLGAFQVVSFTRRICYGSQGLL